MCIYPGRPKPFLATANDSHIVKGWWKTASLDRLCTSPGGYKRSLENQDATPVTKSTSQNLTFATFRDLWKSFASKDTMCSETLASRTSVQCCISPLKFTRRRPLSHECGRQLIEISRESASILGVHATCDSQNHSSPCARCNSSLALK